MGIYDSNRYSAEIIRWVDGDTIELRVDLGQKVYVQDKYRLARVDAPETTMRKGVTKKEKEAGIRLTETLNSKFPPNTRVEVSTSKAGKYGRWLIEMWVMDHETELRYNLSTWLLDEGLAQVWT